MPNTVWVRSLVPKLKNSALSAISPAKQRGPRQFDHRADQVGDRDAGLLHDLAGHPVDDLLQDVELAPCGDQRHHDLGLDRLAGLLHHRGGGLEDRHRLGLVDLRDR